MLQHKNTIFDGCLKHPGQFQAHGLPKTVGTRDKGQGRQWAHENRSGNVSHWKIKHTCTVMWIGSGQIHFEPFPEL